MSLSRSSELKRTPMKRKAPKPRACKVCGGEFVPERVGQKVCKPYPCGVAFAKQAEAKAKERARRAQKAETRAKLESLKTHSQLLKETQAAFNAWIRVRDEGQPCIACGRDHQGQWHASHYRSVGSSPELRFEPDNVHRGCQPCNTHLSGNLIEYRKGLIEKIGIERVEWLEGPHEAKHYTREELREMRREYRKRTRDLQRARA